jgi:hypothetical protein
MPWPTGTSLESVDPLHSPVVCELDRRGTERSVRAFDPRRQGARPRQTTYSRWNGGLPVEPATHPLGRLVVATSLALVALHVLRRIAAVRGHGSEIVQRRLDTGRPAPVLFPAVLETSAGHVASSETPSCDEETVRITSTTAAPASLPRTRTGLRAVHRPQPPGPTPGGQRSRTRRRPAASFRATMAGWTSRRARSAAPASSPSCSGGDDVDVVLGSRHGRNPDLSVAATNLSPSASGRRGRCGGGFAVPAAAGYAGSDGGAGGL